MKNTGFRVLYREFLFRIVDLELLSSHAEGDSRKLLGQFASVLTFISLLFAGGAGMWATRMSDGRVPALARAAGAWTAEHFLIAVTMLVVGLFAVLSWESMFPDRRDVMVLGPLPVRARTLFLAKVAAVATALGLTVASLHSLGGLAWPLALAQADSAPVPALVYDPAMPPVHVAEFPAVMGRDMAPMLRRLDVAAADGRAGIVIGVSEHGVRRVMAYGAAREDSVFEIGSISKTFTGLILARMAREGRLDLRDPVRDLLPAGVAPVGTGFEIKLLDLATHHSGLPPMPDNAGPGDRVETYTGFHDSDLYDFVRRNGLRLPANPKFVYSNLGFSLLGAALRNRSGLGYEELLRREVTDPLGLRDTVVALSAEQRGRFLAGHDRSRMATAGWDLDTFAAAGGIRSTAGDLLTYLEAELRPESTPLAAAIADSQRPWARVDDNSRIGLAWIWDPATGIYAHDGATGGFSSYAFFAPKRGLAGVVLMNATPASYPFTAVLGTHLIERATGRAALALEPVSVPGAGYVRSFIAFWLAMAAAGLFTFCCVLALQGVAAQLLPRRWFLRASVWLQMAVFCGLVLAFFSQRQPLQVLMAGPGQTWLRWVPSYWFVGLYQQLSGGLHPALAPFAWRAWGGLAVAVCGAGVAYAASYWRTLKKIVEEPDIAPMYRGGWMPRVSGWFETAIVHFSLRSLLRSRQHRLIFSFYLGIALAFSILFLNAPAEVSGPAGDVPAGPPSIPLLAATILTMSFWVMGARMAFSLPIDLGANWVFRVMPFEAGPRCLVARRRAMLAIAVVPAFAVCAVAMFAQCPWRLAAVHMAALGLLGVVVAEVTFDSALKLPFTCSYLPGRSNLHVTFPLALYTVLGGVIGCAIMERNALESVAAAGCLVAGLGVAALGALVRSNRAARPGLAELRFEEEPPDKLLELGLTWEAARESRSPGA